MNLTIASIELDPSIQCRAAIDTAVVGDYAERMEAGDQFPPVEVYGSQSKCWIGDGWHRVMAALQRGAETVEATLHLGGRLDALKHALGANAVHGQRRSNADKRRAVEIALREFPTLSSRAVAKMCGVHHTFVESLRPDVATVATSERTGQDGKVYPARREPRLEPTAPSTPLSRAAATAAATPAARPVLAPPSNGMQFARMAVMDLEQIRDDDQERAQAFAFVKEWLHVREN